MIISRKQILDMAYFLYNYFYIIYSFYDVLMAARFVSYVNTNMLICTPYARNTIEILQLHEFFTWAKKLLEHVRKFKRALKFRCRFKWLMMKRWRLKFFAKFFARLFILNSSDSRNELVWYANIFQSIISVSYQFVKDKTCCIYF